jgi:glutamate-ammonia-ligase adenylyltransferase
MSGHAAPTRGALAKAGVLETEAALLALSEFSPETAAVVVAQLAACADPDAALTCAARLHSQHPDVMGRWLADDVRSRALMLLLGVSPVLVEHFLRHIDDLSVIESALHLDYIWSRDDAIATVVAVATGHGRGNAVSKFRRAYRRLVIEVAVRDVVAGDPIVLTWQRLSDCADAALSAALEIAQQQHPQMAQACRLAVVAMGKCGARELNYVSDIDVMFVCDAAEAAAADEGASTHAIAAGATLAAEVMTLCTEPNIEGALWQVDANLRPEGRMGALVRTLASYEDYYRRWAKPWEYQALLKSRAVTGDMRLGDEFVHMVQQFIWNAADGPGFVAEARTMRQRVESSIGQDAQREIKLGPGGLRDVEFSVQLLQLVHGRHDESLRVTSTLGGLSALSDGGYVGREDAATLAQTYMFLRTLEHRLQMRRMQRTHIFPAAEHDIRWLARGVGIMDEPVQALTAQWREVSTDARKRHVKLFYRPLLDAVSRAESGIARLSPEAARERYAALGFADPDAAMRHVVALSGGVSRKSAIQRALMPVILSWLAELPLPDAGLLAFRRVSESLGESPWYLRSLRDETQTAHRLITVLGTSRWLTELLLAVPDAVSMLADNDDLRPRDYDELLAEMNSVVSRADDDAAAVSQVRAIRRRELLRIGCADLLHAADGAAIGEALSVLMRATLQASLDACITGWETSNGEAFPSALAIIAMGRFGGGEIGYGSDADVMFVQRVPQGGDEPVANQSCIDLIGRLRTHLCAPSPEPRVDLDADLRPEGRNGPLVRTVESFDSYYRQWAQVWESQALLRASHAAGDENVTAQLLDIVNRMRWPAGGLTPAEVVEVRRLKARMESERLPRAVVPMAHLKLGPGGLSDVEWVAQLMQLQHAYQLPSLRITGTLATLDAARDAGLITVDDAHALRQAWELCTRVRNHQVLLSGKATDVLPGDAQEAAALAMSLGYQTAEELRQDHARVRRLARRVMERVFYGVAA